MPTSKGSAAVAIKAMPQSAVRGDVLACCKHLRHAANLAELAALGAEPEQGADHILGVLRDLRVELTRLRRQASQHR